MKVGEITAYDETPEDYFTEVITPEEISKMLSRVDSTEEEDFFTGEWKWEYDTIEIKAKDARSFYVLEDKFFDKQRSVLDSRIIGLALIANKEDPETGEQLIGEFKLWMWNKPPAKVVEDIRQRLATPIINIAYGRQK